MSAKTRGKITISLLLAVAGALFSPASSANQTETCNLENDRNEILDGFFASAYNYQTAMVYVPFFQLRQEFILDVNVTKGIASRGDPTFSDQTSLSFERIVSMIPQGGVLNFVESADKYKIESASKVDVLSNVPDSILATVKYKRDEEYPFISFDFMQLASQLWLTAPFDGSIVPDFRNDKISDEIQIVEVRNYPNNTNFRVRFKVKVDGQKREVSSSWGSNSTFVEIQFSFIRLPSKGFTPVEVDQRVGFNSVTGPQWINPIGPNEREGKSYIQKWRLEKSDPTQLVSKAKKPIVFWLDTSIPAVFRNDVRDGVLAWQDVFNAAGISEAIQVYDVPENACWDGSDIDYNVIYWKNVPSGARTNFASPVVNPRTGEIIGADIVIDEEFFENAYRLEELTGQSKTVYQDTLSDSASAPIVNRRYSDEDSETNSFSNEQIGSPDNSAVMSFSDISRNQALHSTLRISEIVEGQEKADQLVSELIKSVVTHEIGHTLGLSHNFSASRGVSLDVLRDSSTTDVAAKSGSIMDYVGPYLLRSDDTIQIKVGQTIGYSDFAAIVYGYGDRLKDPETFKEIEDLLNHFPAKSDDDSDWDYSAVKYDNSDDPIAFAANQLSILKEIVFQQIESGNLENESLYLLLSDIEAQKYRATRPIVDLLGGVEVSRIQSDTGAWMWAYQAASAKDQKRALDFLKNYVFTEDDDLLGILNQETLVILEADFVRPARVPNRNANAILAALLDDDVFARINYSKDYGGDYDSEDYLHDLTEIVFSTDTSDAWRLQNLYVERLIELSRPIDLTNKQRWFEMKYTEVAAQSELRSVRSRMERSLLFLPQQDSQKRAIVQKIDIALGDKKNLSGGTSSSLVDDIIRLFLRLIPIGG